MIADFAFFDKMTFLRLLGILDSCTIQIGKNSQSDIILKYINCYFFEELKHLSNQRELRLICISEGPST